MGPDSITVREPSVVMAHRITGPHRQFASDVGFRVHNQVRRPTAAGHSAVIKISAATLHIGPGAGKKGRWGVGVLTTLTAIPRKPQTAVLPSAPEEDTCDTPLRSCS